MSSLSVTLYPARPTSPTLSHTLRLHPLPFQIRLNLPRQPAQFPLAPLHLQPLPHPPPRLLPPPHLHQTLPPSPPRLPVPGALALHARARVRRALGPHARRHVCLRAVRKQRARLLADQAGGFPAGAAERHFDAVGVELDCLVREGFLQRGVTLLAHFLDLGGAFGVRGEGGWGGGAGGEGEEGAVEGV